MQQDNHDMHRIRRQDRYIYQAMRENLPAYQAYLLALKKIDTPIHTENEVDILLKGVLKKV